MAHTLPSPATRGRRYSQHQVSASITLIPKSAHTFDDSAVAHRHSSGRQESHRPTSSNMQRQDSGYESLDSGVSKSPSDASRRRKSSTSSSGHQNARPPPVTRIGRSSTVGSRSLHGSRASTQSLHLTRSQQQQQVMPTSYFQFPNPEFDTSEALHSPPPLPQTTHYWTSDNTRRLEYAAIDAARHGLKGWMRRNLVPNCMVPKDGGHLDFDDDSGSVRRYRLDLDGDDEAGSGYVEKGDRKGRWPWGKKGH